MKGQNLGIYSLFLLSFLTILNVTPENAWGGVSPQEIKATRVIKKFFEKEKQSPPQHRGFGIHGGFGGDLLGNTNPTPEQMNESPSQNSNSR